MRIKLILIFIHSFFCYSNSCFSQGVFFSEKYLRCNVDILDKTFGETIGLDYKFSKSAYVSISYTGFHDDARDVDVFYGSYATGLRQFQACFGYNVMIWKSVELLLSPTLGYSFENITITRHDSKLYAYDVNQTATILGINMIKENFIFKKMRIFTGFNYAFILSSETDQEITSLKNLDNYVNYILGLGYSFK